MPEPMFESAYQGPPPAWDIGRPQPAVERLAESGQIQGRVLDVGCGTGENALYLAARGFDVTGLDAAPTAIRKAEGKANERGLRATFEVADALDLPVPKTLYDRVIDCGLFHVFSDEERPRFVRSLARVVRPGGTYFMLCFSERQPGDWGPRRVTQAEIRSAFADGWRANYIEPTTFDTSMGPAFAWLASISR